MSRDDAKKEEPKPVVAAPTTAPQTASLLDFDTPQATQQQQTFNPWGAQQQQQPAPVQAPPQPAPVAAQPQWESFAGKFDNYDSDFDFILKVNRQLPPKPHQQTHGVRHNKSKKLRLGRLLAIHSEPHQLNQHQLSQLP